MFKIITTLDGSNSIFNENKNESYHSVNGAIQESQHVFINAGLSNINKNEISVFEVGFGTGLNALLTFIYADNNSLNISYETIELYPLEERFYTQLNYSDYLGHNYQSIFLKLNDCEWNTIVNLTENFSIKKIHNDIRTLQLSKNYDLIYFDAFSPEVEPELWTSKIFEEIYSNMNYNGILVTYCSKGVVRRLLQHVGFIVERIPGPIGKREMIRAIKRNQIIE